MNAYTIYTISYKGQKLTFMNDGETLHDAGLRLCKTWGTTTYNVLDWDRRIDYAYDKSGRLIRVSTF